MMFGFFGMPIMMRPIVPCTMISNTIVQWKNLARLPQRCVSLFSISMLR